MDCSMPDFPVLHYLPEFAQTHVRWVGDDIQPSHLLSLTPPLALNLSQHQGLFQWVGSLHHMAKSLSVGASASASVLPMNIQGWSPLGWTGWVSLLSKGLSNLPQHHSSKASVLQCSAFFMVQLSHSDTNTGKTTALTRWIFASKVMSLLFNMLFGFVITFLPRSKHLMISRLQSSCTVILELPKIKFVTVSTFSLSICHEMMGPNAMILVF